MYRLLDSIYFYASTFMRALLKGGIEGVNLEEEVQNLSQWQGDGGDSAFSSAIQQASSISSGAYTLVVKIGLAIAIIGVVVVGIMFVINSGGAGRQENKGRLINTLAGVLFIGAAVGIVTFMIRIGAGMFGTTATP